MARAESALAPSSLLANRPTMIASQEKTRITQISRARASSHPPGSKAGQNPRILGFCPAFDPGGWLLALALLICVILVFSWLAIIVGLLARSEEGASALSALAIILPYLSSGFVPAAAMPGPLAFFAQVQPLTPITEVMRGVLLGLPADPRMIMLAFGWCALLFIWFRLWGNRLLRRALSTQ